MNNPSPADGRPIPDGLVAAIDETVPQVQGGVTYTLAATIFRDVQAALVVDLASCGVGHMIIESRGELEDGRDRSVILDCLHELTISNLTYDWRTKAEPLLSYPDALAGTTREQLTLGHSPGLARLQQASIVTEVRYVA